jgi:hypothetical protein
MENQPERLIGRLKALKESGVVKREKEQSKRLKGCVKAIKRALGIRGSVISYDVQQEREMLDVPITRWGYSPRPLSEFLDVTVSFRVKLKQNKPPVKP